MTIKTATRYALISVISGVILSLSWQFFSQPVLDELRSRLNLLQADLITIAHVYWTVTILALNGGVILFLSTVYSKQKE